MIIVMKQDYRIPFYLKPKAQDTVQIEHFSDHAPLPNLFIGKLFQA